MDAKVDRSLIEHVAALASLSLTDAERDEMTGEVGAILKYFGELDTLDTSNVPPTAQVIAGREIPLREDRVVEGLSHEEALAQSPRASQGGFAVPAFVEGGSVHGTKGHGT